MRLSTAAIALIGIASSPHVATAFLTSTRINSIATAGKNVASSSAFAEFGTHSAVSRDTHYHLSVSAANVDEETSTAVMDYAAVNKLSFRELQKNCRNLGLPASGTTAVLRSRLLDFYGISSNGAQTEENDNDNAASGGGEEEELCVPDGITFCDESDENFDFNELLNEAMSKANMGHWKAATRKLKQLKRRYATPEQPVPREAYVAALKACVADRLHGARASEPARKILEEMSEQGYEIPADLGNFCIQNCLGVGPGGTHEGCGGIDTALAMLAAMESSSSESPLITVDTYGAVVSALARDGAVDEAVLLLRAMVVEHSFTPPLSVFADVALAAAKNGEMGEIVLQVLTLAKAAGYELDSIASAEAGRSLIAGGVIAAEQMDNVALGLRLLTAAGKAEGCLPDRGDQLVATSSASAQRSCAIIHKRAIDKACKENNWKLAVKLMQLMSERSLTPSKAVWREVVTTCAKCEKSRKATALLLDWAKLSEEGKAEKPPLSVFNTVVNACEICGEQELTLVALESMKKTHDTDGNIITFNIALKRLAKLGNAKACEGIIVGMLEAGIEPTVVSYTTAIGACAQDPKDSAYAYEWLKRMRSRRVRPNIYTYNTVLAACLDGKLESTIVGSKVATEMLADVDRELEEGLKGPASYTSVIPDSYTKVLARQLMKQLRENWRNGDINMQVAKATVRVPLLKLVDFQKSEAAVRVKKQAEAVASSESDGDEKTEKDELDIDFTAVNMIHRTAEV